MSASATRSRRGADGRGRRTSRAPRRAPVRHATPSAPVTAALGRRRLVVLIALTLQLFGLIMVASASSGDLLLAGADQWALLWRQGIYGIVGLAGMWIAMRTPLEVVRRMGRPLVLTCAVLMAAVMVPGLGHSANGASRWLDLGFFQLQPSEPLKLALIILVADHLSRTPPPQHWVNDLIKSPGGVSFLFAGLLVGVQSDLGSGLMVGAVTIVLYMLAGTRWNVLWTTIGPAVALVAFSILAEPYRRHRFLSFLDPWADPWGNGHQLIQSMLAIGSGGVFGVGLGHSVQKLQFLPEAHTDMIFAIVVEELGLIGVVLILGSFALLAGIGTRIALRARTRFSALLAAGITASVVGQAAVNIAGVTGAMPLTGIPLPLISYGGTSLIMTLTALGLLANVATERRPPRVSAVEHPPPDDDAHPFDDDLDDDFGYDDDSDDYDDYAADDAFESLDDTGTIPLPAGADRRGWNGGSRRSGSSRR